SDLLDGPTSADDAAHALVKTMEARGELPALVARLEREKPLVVWPEPKPVAVAPAIPSPASTPRQPDPGPAPAPPSEPLVDPFLGELETAPAPAWRPAVVVGAVAVGIGLGALGMWLVFFRGEAPENPTPEGTVSPATIAAATLRESV